MRQPITYEVVEMSERPDWVHCVGFGNAIRPDGKKTWCGKPGGFGEPFFVSVDHAALNGESGGRMVACPECLSAITKALKNGYEAEE